MEQVLVIEGGQGNVVFQDLSKVTVARRMKEVAGDKAEGAKGLIGGSKQGDTLGRSDLVRCVRDVDGRDKRRQVEIDDERTEDVQWKAQWFGNSIDDVSIDRH